MRVKHSGQLWHLLLSSSVKSSRQVFFGIINVLLLSYMV